MEILQMFIGIMIFMGLPVGFYLLNTKPKFERRMRPAIISGVIMVVTASLPIASMAGMFMIAAWIGVVPVMLLVNIIIWVVAAIKKKPEFIAGPVMVGATVICSGVILGNWFAVIAAVVYLVMLVRYRYDLSFD